MPQLPRSRAPRFVRTLMAVASVLIPTFSAATVRAEDATFVDVGYFQRFFDGAMALQCFRFASPAGESQTLFVGNQNTIFFGGGDIERRSYFVFDVSGMSTPIEGAALRVFAFAEAAANGNNGAYNSADATETYALYSLDATTTATILATPFNDQSDPALYTPIFDDLGDGTLLGARLYSEADELDGPGFGPAPFAPPSTDCALADTPCGRWVSVPLTVDGVAALESAILAGGNFGFGVAVSSIGPNPVDVEWLQSGTLVDLDPGKSVYPDFLAPEPVLATSLPEPAAGLGLATATLALAAAGRHRTRDGRVTADRRR